MKLCCGSATRVTGRSRIGFSTRTPFDGHHPDCAAPTPQYCAGLLPQVPLDRADAVAAGPAPPQARRCAAFSVVLLETFSVVSLKTLSLAPSIASCMVTCPGCRGLAPLLLSLAVPPGVGGPVPAARVAGLQQPTAALLCENGVRRFPATAAWWCCPAATIWSQQSWSWRSSSWLGTLPRCVELRLGGRLGGG